MSKFVEKIKRASNKTVVPLGFKKPSSEEEVPSILLIADMAGATQKQARELTESGIDAALLDLNNGDSQELSKLQKNIGDLPFGFQINTSFSDDMDNLIERGCDFVVFDTDVDINLVDKEKLGKVLQMEKSMTPSMIKAIGDLNMNIDCLLITSEKKSVDLNLLLTCHLYKDILNKPILINIENTPSKSELEELNAAGVRGLILSSKTPPAVVRELGKLIRELPKSVKKKSTDRPLIPALNVSAPAGKEEVEQEEEEDIRERQ